MKYSGVVIHWNALLAISAILSITLPNTSAAATTCPCDIYAAAGTPCVAAHSTVRLLVSTYTGPLYQVRRSSDNTTKDIGTVSGGTAANAAAQDSFCSGTCVITKIYDQSGHGNFLEYQGSGSSIGGKDQPSSATAETFFLSGHKVYSLWINPGNSYWRNGSTTGMPLNSTPEGMYMVTSGTHFNDQCCFDYGNSETTRAYAGPGAMDAINFSAITQWGTGAGKGPWIMADLEGGIFAQNNTGKSQNDPSQTSKYVTAVLKNNGTTEFTLKGSNAQSGSLTTYYKGGTPGNEKMVKQGAIVLGSGGDCCATNNNLSDGTFYEGVIVSGYPTDAAENAVQANIVAAGYGSATPVEIVDKSDNAQHASSVKVHCVQLNGGAVVGYTLQRNQRVSVNILDQRGRKVASVVDGVFSAGPHEAVWHANRVPAGVYVWRVVFDGIEERAGKIVLGK